MSDQPLLELAAIWAIFQTRPGQQILIAAGSIIVALLGANLGISTLAYGWGKDAGEKNLTQLQTIKDINLPELNKQTRDAAAELRKATDSVASLIGAQKRADDLQAQNEKLSKESAQVTQQLQTAMTQNKATAEKLKSVESALEQYISPDWNRSINAGASATFYSGQLTVGYTYSYGIEGGQIYLNGKPHPALPAPINAEGLQNASCKVTPTTISRDNISVSVHCSALP